MGRDHRVVVGAAEAVMGVTDVGRRQRDLTGEARLNKEITGKDLLRSRSDSATRSGLGRGGEVATERRDATLRSSEDNGGSMLETVAAL